FLGAALVVFLIACANAANLLLARVFQRRPELALRVSLGAGRWSLIRQVFGESALLAGIGAGCGLVLAYWGVKFFAKFASAPELEIPRVKEISIDGYAFGFAALTALIAVLFAGLPAIRLATGVDPNEALKTSGRGFTSTLSASRSRNSLVIAELTLCMVLLVGAGLFVASLVRLKSVSPGFDPHHLLTMRLLLRGPGFDSRTQKR